MSITENDQFCNRLQESCPVLVDTLRHLIKQDVDHDVDKSVHLKNYYRYQIALPPLKAYQDGYRTAFLGAIVDYDMQNDLERSKVINFCRTVKKLYPLKTTADGNCLLHAISQALWGIEDSDNYLRRIIYLNISMDKNDQFRKRWLLHQQTFLQNAQQDLRLNTEEFNIEWESVAAATYDIQTPDNHGLPYRTLEEIHLFVAANALKRPIIVLAESVARNVYGQSLQDSHIGGIYLPLHLHPQQCYKSPIVIGYSMNHFAPLVFEQDTTSGDLEMQAVPLVTKEITMLECKFLLPNEENNAWTLLKKYLNLKEGLYDGIPLPVAVLNHCPLPETVNIVNAFKKNCERKFERLTGVSVAQAVQSSRSASFPEEQRRRESRSPVPAAQGPRSYTLPAGGVNLPQDFSSSGHYGPFHQQEPIAHQTATGGKCVTVSCKRRGDANLHGLCSTCFKDFTVQYAKQEEATRKLLQKPQIPLTNERHAPRKPQYYDLSMMGEDCQAKCGFKCAVETYPYCHECYPKYVKQPARQPATVTQEEVSIMPDQCHTHGCKYRCSKATYPYCHECFEKHQQPLATPPTAPPPSVAHVTYPGPGQPNSDETAVVSLRDRSFMTAPQIYQEQPRIQQESRKCKSIRCTLPAEKGNDGYCDSCYQLCLFGPNVPPMHPTEESVCCTPQCKNSVADPLTAKCKSCFLKDDNDLFGGGQNHFAMNIGPKQEERKILNQTNYSQVQPVLRSMPEEHDETREHSGNMLQSEIIELQRRKQELICGPNKYICATPGCQGLRFENEDYCLSCTRGEIENLEPTQEINLNLSQAEVSATPIELSQEEIKELNPVVISSRDKIKCPYQGCENMIYPPKKLCDECTGYLDQAKSIKSKKQNKQQVRQEGGDNKQCLTPGCTFYGSREYGGYCSGCYKGIPPKHQTAPILARPKPVKEPTYQTAPIARQSGLSRTVSQTEQPGSRGKRCITPGCSKFGDPAQKGRCSEHFALANSPVPPTSDESIQRLRPLVFQTRQETYNGPTQSARVMNAPIAESSGSGILGGHYGNQQPTQNNDQFLNAIGKLENSQKSRQKCKNAGIIKCKNFGNSRTEGYCNTCYEHMKATEHLRRH